MHPINVKVGGFYRAPTKRELRALVDDLERAREFALETVRFTAGLDFPDFEQDYELVSLAEPGTVPDRPRPHRLEPRPRHPRRRVRAAFRRGARRVVERAPLARDRARQLPGRPARPLRAPRRPALAARQESAAEVGLDPAERNPFRSIVVRSVELVYAADEALRLIAEYEEPDAPAVEVVPRAGVGYGAARRRAGSAGTATSSTTTGSSSTRRSSRRPRRTRGRSRPTCAASSSGTPTVPDDELSLRCEQTIRNYDPCISCATHFLELEVDRRMTVIGLGNEWRSDDGVGPEVGAAAGRPGAERRADRARRGARRRSTRSCSSTRVSSGAPPGRSTRSTPARSRCPRRLFGASSTHALGLAEAVELARSLGRLPRRVLVYGIEGASFAFGKGLSPEVEAAADRVVEEVSACTRSI